MFPKQKKTKKIRLSTEEEPDTSLEYRKIRFMYVSNFGVIDAPRIHINLTIYSSTHGLTVHSHCPMLPEKSCNHKNLH